MLKSLRTKTKIKKFFSLIIIFSIVFYNIGFFVFPLHVSAAAALTRVTATPSDVTAGNASSYTITFKTTASIANTGKVTLEFPAGFNVSGASFGSWTGFDGNKTLTVAGQVITITRTSGTSSAAGLKTIVLGNIVNNSALANNYQVIVTTKNSANTVLNGPTSSVYFQIFSSHEETNIDGLYYLRSSAQTHYQANNTSGSGDDLGVLSRTAPVSAETRHCGGWLQFFFDENGTYSQNNEISNIYYHVWWYTTQNQATLGYESTGVYTPTATESFTIDRSNSENNIGGYNLYAGTQVPATARSFFGNDIYNFNILPFKNSGKPAVISSPEQGSFVILNLPNNIDTLGISQDGDLDYDDDGVSDYDELFTNYTNPYESDTDNDGWDDEYEELNNFNPLDSDSAPEAGSFKKYEGATASGRFGSAISSISDIDGDGFQDILVGESGSNKAYIYSSKTGDLLRQYVGDAGAIYFGGSVSSISDVDGDGLDDVLIGSQYSSMGGDYTGSVYLYSSGSGELIRRYDGPAGAFSNFGKAIGSISDIDGDDLDDILVGAASANSNAGSAYIYSSASGDIIRQFSGGAMEGLGSSVSSISDIDGDGLEDVIIGAYMASPGGVSYAGSAFIFSSGTGNQIERYDGAGANGAFGSSVVPITDLDGDGLDDIIISSPAYTDVEDNLVSVGIVDLYSSSGNFIRQYSGVESADRFGESVSSISDIDNDGLDDVVIGARGEFGSGYVSILSSGSGNELIRYTGERRGDIFGVSVSSLSDVDGDGLDDVAVGADYSDPQGVFSAGAAYLLYSGGMILDQSWSKGDDNLESFDLDDYFIEKNNLAIPARNQAVTYTASTDDNEYIDVTIDSDNRVSFAQPAEWTGTEEVVFTATDSTGLSSSSDAVSLTVLGTNSLNTPTIDTPTVNSPNSITWKWIDNSEIEDSYSVDYDNDGGGAALGVSDLYPQNSKSSSGSNLIWTDEDLSPNTEYSVSVKAHRSDMGFGDSSETSDSVYTLVESPTHFSASIDSDDILLSVERFVNDDDGLSGYYFENTTNGNNSGWINDNFWQDDGLKNSTEYTYSVRYRNGDGVETDPVVIDATTSSMEEDHEDTIDDSSEENYHSNNSNNSRDYFSASLGDEQENIDSDGAGVDLKSSSHSSDVLDSGLDNSATRKNWIWVFVIISIVLAGSIGFIVVRMKKTR